MSTQDRPSSARGVCGAAQRAALVPLIVATVSMLVAEELLAPRAAESVYRSPRTEACHPEKN
jgi:hypothetical protein